jgi:hypothetical protein
MRSRKSRSKTTGKWAAPPDLPPSPDRLGLYLLDARQPFGDTESEAEEQRIAAVGALAILYRQQSLERLRLIREARDEFAEADPMKADFNERKVAYEASIARGNRAVDPRLQQFLEDASDEIWRSIDPVAALTRFLNGTAKRGAKRKYAYRDFRIATEVAGRMLKGEKRDAACEAVACEFQLGCDAVLNIYKRRDKVKVKVQLGLFG